MQDWVDKRAGDLVTRNAIEKGVCYADSEFFGSVTISGAVTDSAHYMWLTAAPGERHYGLTDAGVRINGQSISSAVIVKDNYSVVEWLSIHNIGNSGMAIEVKNNLTGVQGATIRNNLIYNTEMLPNSSGIWVTGMDGLNSCRIYNNMVCRMGKGIYSSQDNLNHSIICNNTVFACSEGITSVGVSAIPDTLYNNISLGCDIDYLIDINKMADYNCADIGFDLPGSHNVFSIAGVELLSTSDISNLHLKGGATCRDMGISAGTWFINDIDGEKRESTWDMGADELN